MGRRRKKDLHLPKRMYERRGKFYFDSPVTGKWEPLGDDIASALAKYGQLIGPVWSGRTLADVLQRYKSQITPLPLRGRARKRDAIDNEIRTLSRFERLFGHMHQDSLTQQHLYTYIDRRIDEREEFRDLKKPAPSAARHDVRFLRKVLAKGIKWGAGTVNAALNLELEPDPKNERDVTEAEFQAVYALANERMRIAMDLAQNIGQRRGDLLKIRREDLTQEGILIHQGKTRAPVLIEWTEALRAIVARAQALKPDIPRDHLLRTRSGTAYTKDGFNAIWQRLMRKATLPGKDGGPPILAARFKFHDLRAKAATEKADRETDEEAQKLLGHREVKTTRGYIRHKKPTRAKPVR